MKYGVHDTLRYGWEAHSSVIAKYGRQPLILALVWPDMALLKVLDLLDLTLSQKKGSSTLYSWQYDHMHMLYLISMSLVLLVASMITCIHSSVSLAHSAINGRGLGMSSFPYMVFCHPDVLITRAGLPQQRMTSSRPTLWSRHKLRWVSVDTSPPSSKHAHLLSPPLSLSKLLSR